MQAQLWIACALALACAGAPRADPGSALVFGQVRLVPKAGAELAPARYGDRRLRNVERVDYTRPGFAVVFADGEAVPRDPPAELALEDGARRVGFRPSQAATALRAGVVVTNRSARTHVVSAPAAGFVRALAPGERAAIAPAEAGELELHVVGAEAASAVVFVAPGVFALVGPDGRYALRGLAPGAVSVRAWHPRLPVSAPRRIEVAAGEARRLDLAIGVDQAGMRAP